MKTKSIFFVLCVILIFACRKEKEPEKEVIPESSIDYEQALRDAISEVTNGNSDTLVLPMSQDLSSIPQDPLNPLSQEKIELGKYLFHETALGRANQKPEGYEAYSCATCHHASAGFFAGLPQGVGEGGVGFGIAGEARVFSSNYQPDSVDAQSIITPSAMNVAFQQVMTWNGQFGATGPNEDTEGVWEMGTPAFFNQFGYEGVETRAIAGLNIHRMLIDNQLMEDIPGYQTMFDNAFPDWPMATRYSNRTGGLAIAAYLRTIFSNEAPFQDWLQGDDAALSDAEKRGALVFFGEGKCYECHNGPALNSMTFYSLGVNDLQDRSDIYIPNPDKEAFLGRGGFTHDIEENYQFKTPQLYNLKEKNAFGHGASFSSVLEIIQYKNAAEPENLAVPFNRISEEFVPLGLTSQQMSDLAFFIEESLYDDNLTRYVPANVPSGNCFPNNDAQSQSDLGCN